MPRQYGRFSSPVVGTPPTDLADLADVDADAPTDQYFLKWDETLGRWVPGAVAAATTAASVTFNDTSDIEADDVQGAIEEVAADATQALSDHTDEGTHVLAQPLRLLVGATDVVRKELAVVAGDNVTLTPSDDGSTRLTVTVAASAGETPAAQSKQVESAFVGDLEETTGPPIRFPREVTLTQIKAEVLTAPIGADVLVDLQKAGRASAASVLSTPLRIAAGRTSGGALPATTTVYAGEWLVPSITQVGGSTVGADLTVIVEYLETAETPLTTLDNTGDYAAADNTAVTTALSDDNSAGTAFNAVGGAPRTDTGVLLDGEDSILLSTISVTVDSTTDVLTATSHGLSDGDTVRMNATTLPGSASTGTTYHVRDATANTFKISTSAGGAALNMSSNGTAVVVMPDRYVEWQFTDTSDVYFRFYVRFAAAPSISTRIATFYDGSTSVAHLYYSTTPKVQLRDSTDTTPAGQVALSATLTAGQWHRVEGRIVCGSSGFGELQVFDTHTATTGPSVSSVSSASLGTKVNKVRFGRVTAGVSSFHVGKFHVGAYGYKGR